METNYWSRILQRRVSRRRTVALTSAAAFSAAFLAACGGSSNNNGSTGAAPTATKPASSGATGTSGASGATGSSGAAPSGLLSKREDTTAQAKPGGTLIMDNPLDPPHFDPHLLTLPAAAAVSLIYNKLLGVKPGSLQISDGTIEGDLAQSWEFSPDKLTLTMKIRTDAGTPPNQAPVNGRKLDADDVVFSWDRWAKTGSNRQDLVNSVNPAAPVLSLTAVDKNTIQIKLKEPISSILAGFSSQLQGQYFILPKEADGGFDVRNTPIGAGTYSLSNFTPSVGLTYERNPNSYEKKAYPQTIKTPIITEASQVIAQLTAGNIYTHYTAISPDSVVQMKKDAPKIGLYQTDIANVGVSVFFGFKQSDKAPFRDERVRQAFSMAMDRDQYLDTFANVSKFQKDGLQVDTAWNSAVQPAAYKGWYLDPKSKDFGDNAKYFQFNIAEAKKLLSAAGYANGLSVDSHEAAGTNYGLAYAPQIEVIHGMMQEAGFKLNRLQHEVADWNPNYRDSHGFFEGIAFRLTPVPAEPGDSLFALYNKDGSLNYGFDPDGKGIATKDGPFVGDPTCDDLTAKMRSEFDNAKRIQYAIDLQKYLGEKQYFYHALASATGFNVAWPAVRNFSVFNGLSWGFLWQRYWMDNTQAPLA